MSISVERFRGSLLDEATTINAHFIVFTFDVLRGGNGTRAVAVRVFLSQFQAHFVSSVTAHLVFSFFSSSVHNHAGSRSVFIHHSHLSRLCVCKSDKRVTSTPRLFVCFKPNNLCFVNGGTFTKHRERNMCKRIPLNKHLLWSGFFVHEHMR